MIDTVLTTMDDEAVQVLVAPAQRRLQGDMQVGDGAVAADQQAPPDQGADTAEDDPQLVDDRFGAWFQFRHLAIVRLAGSSVPPTVFPALGRTPALVVQSLRIVTCDGEQRGTNVCAYAFDRNQRWRGPGYQLVEIVVECVNLGAELLVTPGDRPDCQFRGLGSGQDDRCA